MMNETSKVYALDEILLRRRNRVIINNLPFEKADTTQYAITAMKNFESLGYTFSKDLFERLCNSEVYEIKSFYEEYVPMIKKLVGANVEYNPMYPNFPQQVIEADDIELFVNAIVHYWSWGTIIPEYEKKERFPLIGDSNLKVLEIGSYFDIDEILNNLISSKTSLSEQDKNDMVEIFTSFRIPNPEDLPDEIPFKENMVVIADLLYQTMEVKKCEPILKKYFKTATDVLRLAVRLSDGDVSLADNTEFITFSRPTRRLLLSLLENCGNIEEDMVRYKGQWIRLGEKLHPREYKQFVKVNTAFQKLRNDEKIETFNGRVEELLVNGQYHQAAMLLKNRPGEFARRLDHILRSIDNVIAQNAILDEFEKVAKDVSVPVLLQMATYFINRSNSDSRVFFPKGNLTKAYTIENNLAKIDLDVCIRVAEICSNAIFENLKNKEPLGKVYVSNSIDGYVIPQSQRSASSGMRNITRCSRFNINENANFIRLGIHWMNEIVERPYNNGKYEQRTDIDLSCSFLDENFGSVNHVSYTHLRNAYSTHSGDFTDAPRATGGACEFVDINIDKALEAGVKYAAVQVYGYTATKFCDLEDMLFTWQEREDSDCGDIFEPSRVQQCINLTGETDCSIPVIFDIENREVIWCDLALSTRTNFPRCVEGNIRGLSATAMGICQSHKPQMIELALSNAIARGDLTVNRNEADVIFDLDTTKPVIKEEVVVEVRDTEGNVIETRKETREKVRDDVRIITPFDTDIWMGEML